MAASFLDGVPPTSAPMDVSQSSSRPDGDHRLEREHIRLLLIDDARRGIADIQAGRCLAADAAIAQIQQRRARNSGAINPAP